ncbi:MAG TPA: response regulator transcription factor [Acidimicrobiales bacterium]|nr:response regulator transcription factor [Acidimicrobiales bacterium]
MATAPEGVLRVLLVEDDPDLRSLLETMLDKDGRFVVVAHATTAGDAIRLAEAERPDAVVVDLGLDGLVALPGLRASLPGARIVVLSEFPDPLTLADTIGQGVDSYIDKGRTWCELIPTLAGLCLV